VWTVAINDGNKAAHDGDAVTDASLYELNIRNDSALICRIYGKLYIYIYKGWALLKGVRIGPSSPRYQCPHMIHRSGWRL
jgi:hypothetical protein